MAMVVDWLIHLPPFFLCVCCSLLLPPTPITAGFAGVIDHTSTRRFLLTVTLLLLTVTLLLLLLPLLLLRLLLLLTLVLVLLLPILLLLLTITATNSISERLLEMAVRQLGSTDGKSGSIDRNPVETGLQTNIPLERVCSPQATFHPISAILLSPRGRL